MDPAELARLEHVNLVEAFALFAATPPGAVVRRHDGVAILSSGLPFILFNQLIVEADSVAAAAVSDGVALMRRRASPLVVNLRVGADDEQATAMAGLGLVPLSDHPWLPGMAKHPAVAESPPPGPPGFEIRCATDRGGIEAHVRTAAAGFDMAEELIGAVVTQHLLGRLDVAVYAGYADGTPVATGLGFRTGRTIGVYNIATINSARGRGYGDAMTRRVIADGVDAGCNVAILQASVMGRAIYERIGFRTVVEYMGYTEPGPVATDGTSGGP